MDTLAPETETVQTGLKRLEKIEEDLDTIKEHTANPKRSFVNGMVQGAGAILGSIFALVILGWLLSILGVLPGFHSLAAALHVIVSRFDARY